MDITLLTFRLTKLWYIYCTYSVHKMSPLVSIIVSCSVQYFTNTARVVFGEKKNLAKTVTDLKNIPL